MLCTQRLQWPAMSLWKDLSFFEQTCGDTMVSVNLTPNGFADAVTNVDPSQRRGELSAASGDTPLFVKPQEVKMPMAAFVALLKDTTSTSKQI